MLAINPDECIDCGVCEPECPIGAIVSDTVDVENKEKWLLLNKKFSALWPNINKKKILCLNTKSLKKSKINLISIFQKNHLNKYAKKKKTKKKKKKKKKNQKDSKKK